MPLDLLMLRHSDANSGPAAPCPRPESAGVLGVSTTSQRYISFDKSLKLQGKVV